MQGRKAQRAKRRKGSRTSPVKVSFRCQHFALQTDEMGAEDFEVAIFLKETSTRHSLLTKQKDFSDKPKMKSTGNKLTGWLNNNENPITITDDAQPPAILQEQDDDDIIELQNIPEANIGNKRSSSGGDDDANQDALFVSSSDEDFFTTQRAKPSTKRRKVSRSLKAPSVENSPAETMDDDDDKKKMLLDTSYDGFSIYGRILCLIVTRKGKRDVHPGGPIVGGSQMMEQWVSTQAANEAGLGDDDD